MIAGYMKITDSEVGEKYPADQDVRFSPMFLEVAVSEQSESG
jgi:hypothetical protein